MPLLQCVRIIFTHFSREKNSLKLLTSFIKAEVSFFSIFCNLIIEKLPKLLTWYYKHNYTILVFFFLLFLLYSVPNCFLIFYLWSEKRFTEHNFMHLSNKCN